MKLLLMTLIMTTNRQWLLQGASYAGGINKGRGRKYINYSPTVPSQNFA